MNYPAVPKTYYLLFIIFVLPSAFPWHKLYSCEKADDKTIFIKR